MSGGGTSARTVRGGEVRVRVLIVDDEPLIGTTLRVLLSDEHDVVVASSGNEAQALLEADRSYDVILCDLMMPALNGMDLFAWLRREDPTLAQRMVFMTGGVFTDDARTFLDAVPNARIEKPFDHDELLEVIRGVEATS